MEPLSPSAMRSMNQWVARIIPLLLFGAIGYSAYVVIKVICLDYYMRPAYRAPESDVGIAFLVPFCILLFLAATAYLRLILVIFFDPGLVPLGPRAEEERSREQQGRAEHDLEGQRYSPGPVDNADSPGLEQFYHKDVFVCQDDGRPRWCSHCMAWKPDRAHHSSEMNRCVRKMDHFCPWVGGIISETSFKFFIQFVFYAALFCAIALTASAYNLAMRNSEQQAAYSADPRVIAVIALGSFFGLFTFSMTLATVRYIFINQTNVDVLKSKTLLHQLAIRVPRDTPPDPRFKTVTYPLPTHVAIPSSNGTASDSSNTTNQTPATDKDRLATRTFAIVKTQMGENPWDLGLYANWVSIMGTNVFEWVLPLHQSPCVGEESSESFYRLGPLYPELRRRYGLPDLRPARKGREMRQRRR